MSEDCDLIFIDDSADECAPEEQQLAPWLVLIVDDEPQIHSVTQLVLRDFIYQGRKLQFLNAHSASEAASILSQTPDVAVALVDVVMESDSAGLDLINQIRHELNNQDIRLILRTGQPGLAPIKQVIRDYDVSDYKNKTELSEANLDTLMCASLRAYQEIIELRTQQQRLRAAISCSSQFHIGENIIATAQNCVQQATQLIENPRQALSVLAMTIVSPKLSVFEATGKLAYLKQTLTVHELPSRVQDSITDAQRSRQNIYNGQRALLTLQIEHTPLWIYLEAEQELSSPQQEALTSLFASMQLALDNQRMQKQLAHAELQLLLSLKHKLDALANTPSNDEQQLAQVLAKALGWPEQQQRDFSTIIYFNDLGALGLPEAMLTQTTHGQGNWQQLSSLLALPPELRDPKTQALLSQILTQSSQINENWDGSGHPFQLRELQIDKQAHLAALVVELCSQQELFTSPEQLDQHMRSLAGKRFDPSLWSGVKSSLFEFLKTKHAD